jgi:hypothetical protein
MPPKRFIYMKKNYLIPKGLNDPTKIKSYHTSPHPKWRQYAHDYQREVQRLERISDEWIEKGQRNDDKLGIELMKNPRDLAKIQYLREKAEWIWAEQAEWEELAETLQEAHRLMLQRYGGSPHWY